MGHRKPVIGLCGAIGAGKSRVAEEFARLGASVIDSDRLNHDVLRRAELLAELRSWWGARVVSADGTPNRSEIAKIIFNNAVEKRRLESLVHPLIAALRSDMMRVAFADPAVRAIILDSPLLLESRLDRLCDRLVFVEVSEQRRLERLARDRGWDAPRVRERERWQMTLDEKRRRCDLVIDNDGSADDLRAQAAAILQRIISEHPASE